MVIVASTVIHTDFGDFTVNYHESKNGECVSFSKGDVNKGMPVVRLHSACLFGEAFHSKHCDCAHQVSHTMKLIDAHGGVIVYSYQEGRGIGLKKKIQAMEVQRKNNCDTVEAFKQVGLEKSDYRTYAAEIDALNDLQVSKEIKVDSGNKTKIDALENAGYEIKEFLKFDDEPLSKWAKAERETKKKKMNYRY